LLEIDCEIDIQKIIDGVENRCLRPESKAVILGIWLIWNGQSLQFLMDEFTSKQWQNSLEIK
jgi:hypothetical protein